MIYAPEISYFEIALETATEGTTSSVPVDSNRAVVLSFNFATEGTGLFTAAPAICARSAIAGA